MGISTCSGAISLSRELEKDSSRFYLEMSKKFEKDKDLFLGLVRENDKYISQIERAYYGVITDAIEGCFAFDLDPEVFKIKAIPSADAGYPEALREALTMEEKILEFYRVAAEQSKHLMADVPRAFLSVAKKRAERLNKLKSLLDQSK